MCIRLASAGVRQGLRLPGGRRGFPATFLELHLEQAFSVFQIAALT